MYQEILPHIYHNHYREQTPSLGDIILSYDGNNVLMKEEDAFYRYEEVPHDRSFTYLFQIDEQKFFLSNLKDVARHSLSVQIFRRFQPKEMAFAGITGWQLYLWYRDNQYCGRCGGHMHEDSVERAMRCDHCGNIVYPKIMPAVIVAVRNDQNQILLTRYAHGSYQNYALVAGFNEIGETIEETAVREVKEETGLDVTDLHYYRCQPWSFSSTILFGFWARAHGNQTIHMDDGELKLAVWKNRNDPDITLRDEASLTAEMIRKFQKGEDEY